MESDPIVAEIRNLREQRAARFGFDLKAIVEDARRRDASGDREVVERQCRTPVSPAGFPAEATASVAIQVADSA